MPSIRRRLRNHRPLGPGFDSRDFANSTPIGRPGIHHRRYVTLLVASKLGWVSSAVVAWAHVLLALQDWREVKGDHPPAPHCFVELYAHAPLTSWKEWCFEAYLTCLTSRQAAVVSLATVAIVSLSP